MLSLRRRLAPYRSRSSNPALPSTASQFHADQIRACADAGKHIFCEKPIATDLVQTIEAVNYCRKKNVKLMTALQRRFDPK